MLFAPGNINLEKLCSKECQIIREEATKLIYILFDKNNIELPTKITTKQATEKSQVYFVHTKNCIFVAKFHKYSINFRRELQGYLLLRGSYIPKIICYCEKKKIIIISYEFGTIFKESLDSLKELTKSIAFIHNSFHSNIKIFPRKLQNKFTLNSISIKENRINWRHFLLKYIELWGGEHISASLADIKPEHIIVNNRNYCFIDLETFMIGRPEVHDLLCLMNFVESKEYFVDVWKKSLSEIYTKYLHIKLDKLLLTDSIFEYYHLYESKII